MNQLLGQQGGQVVQMIGALLVVVVLIVVFAWGMRRFAGGRSQPARRGGDRQTQRLAVVDAAHVDGQRRLVLVRRDDVEHLVMIGGPNDVLIEPRIVRGQPQGGQRTAPGGHYAGQQPHVAQPVMAPPQTAQQPVRATAQQPNEPASVPMPPPFVEAVTSPAVGSRPNPIASDLRAAMAAASRAEDMAPTQRAQMPLPPQQPQQQPTAAPYYDEAPVPSRAPVAEPAPYAPARPGNNGARPMAPAPSLEDMVAAGLEQAIARPDPMGTRAIARPAAPPPYGGQRTEPTSYDTRTPAKDAVAAEIEKAIYGLTAPGATAPPARRPAGRPAPEPARPAPPARMEPARMEPPRPRMEPRSLSEPTAPVNRMPPAAPPSFPRPQPAPARPTLVAPQEQAMQEPVVAVLPQPDTVRADARADNGRRSSSDIEDEMARLLSELTGTTGR